VPLALPNVIVVGAMKCATTAMHRYLDAHPQVSMSTLKEVNFFIGSEVAPHDDPETWWRSGLWHRGVAWYASLFDPTAPVRGETSPGYTSPDAPEVPARMAGLIPEARLLYLVRHPVDRAVSQYRHHYRDGTERRPLEDALLDPASQYLARSRYHERLAPYLQLFPVEQILVVVQERLLRDRCGQMETVYRHLGVDPDWRGDVLAQEFHVGGDRVNLPPKLSGAFMQCVEDDLAHLRALLQDDLPEWSA
jgi:Sulfotransferase family